MEYLLVTCILIACAFAYIKIATKFNIVDDPNFRSSHTVPVIRGGGILFYIAVLVSCIWNQLDHPFFLIGISCLATISFLDDIYTLSAKVRLPFHFISVGLVLYEIGLFDGPWYIWAVVLILGVGFVNLYNFMDGINGITGVYSIVVVLSFLILSYKEQLMNTSLFFTLLISLGIFGYFNFRKNAQIFAGDIGSMSMAISIFFFGLYFIVTLEAPVLLLLVAIYCADSILTIIYKMSIGESITEPHRFHIYQKLIDVLKLSHLKVAYLYGGYQLIISVIVFITYHLPLNHQLFVILGVALLLMLHYYVLFKKLKRII